MLTQRFGGPYVLSQSEENVASRTTKTGRGSSLALAFPGLFWLIVFFSSAALVRAGLELFYSRVRR